MTEHSFEREEVCDRSAGTVWPPGAAAELPGLNMVAPELRYSGEGHGLGTCN